jgi:Ser/Thr protein kinase RdoA (MazF antagonist)
MNTADFSVLVSQIDWYISYQKGIFFSKVDGGFPVALLDAHAPIHEESIRQIMQKHFGVEVKNIVELTRWTLHYVYKVETTDKPYIIRINAAGMFYHEFQFYVEAWATEELERVGLKTLNIPLIDLKRDDIPFDYEVMDFAPGKSIHEIIENNENQNQVLEKLGEYVAAIHHIKTTDFGPIHVASIIKTMQGDSSLQLVPRGIHHTWTDYILLNSIKHIEYAVLSGIISADEADSIAERLKPEVCPNVPIPCLVHGDIATHNAFSQNGEITALIDWEDCISGDSVYDIAYFGTESYGHESFFPPFLKGYKSKAELPPDFEKRYWLYFLRISLMKSLVRERFKALNEQTLAYIRERIIFALEQAKDHF